MPTLCNSLSNVSTLRKITERAKLDSRNLALFQLFDELEDDFEDLAAASGFEIAATYGDYAYSEFRQDASPFMIWVLQKK